MDDGWPALIERRTALLDEWTVKQREIAVFQAEASALLARRWELWQEEVAPQPGDAIERSMLTEYSAAGHVSQSSMTFAFADAHLLATDFATVRESFAAGLVSAAHIREILREAAPVRAAIEAGVVEASALLLYEAAVLETAESDTAARTRAQDRRIAASLRRWPDRRSSSSTNARGPNARSRSAPSVTDSFCCRQCCPSISPSPSSTGSPRWRGTCRSTRKIAIPSSARRSRRTSASTPTPCCLWMAGCRMPRAI